jgi:hypothetical protein
MLRVDQGRNAVLLRTDSTALQIAEPAGEDLEEIFTTIKCYWNYLWPCVGIWAPPMSLSPHAG